MKMPQRTNSLYSTGSNKSTSPNKAGSAAKPGAKTPGKGGKDKVTAQDNEGSIDLTTEDGEAAFTKRRDPNEPEEGMEQIEERDEDENQDKGEGDDDEEKEENKDEEGGDKGEGES